MTDAPDISACIALAREAKDDIDDIVGLAASSVRIEEKVIEA